MTTATPIRQDPPIVLDAAWSDRLEELAAVAIRRGLGSIGDRLMAEVARATVLPSEDMPDDVVNIGSGVRYRDETTGREQSVTLVLPQEVDIDRGRISVLTPIGAALIGLKAGASIGWETREGEDRRLTVLDVTPAA